MLDLIIILGYFSLIMAVAFRARLQANVSVDDYFVSGRNLGWWSIAASTIATNLHAGHFLAVIGSAYAFGLAQANFELNAIFGLLMAAFVFVPIYLRAKVVTVTQYFEQKFGPNIALTYSVLTMFMYGTLYLGSALFWGGYAMEVLYGESLQFYVGGTAALRICIMIVLLGGFSATYTYFGGLGAVVKTDVIQFILLLTGGIVITVLAVKEVGGLGTMNSVLGDRMHLHLPNSHAKLPWLGIITMNILNLQYWGCNQVILQRSIAAKSLAHAQMGLLVGGFFKFITAAMLVLPGIALVAILGDGNQLSDPDQAYIKVVDLLLSPGIKGIVLCGMFASLMSSVDSIFNSISTLWSMDIYKRKIAPDATDRQIVAMGRKSILVTMGVGIAFGFAFTYVKMANPEFPLDPLFKKISFFIKNGFVILICAAVFLVRPSRWLVTTAFYLTVPLAVLGYYLFPNLPYLILTGIVIILAFLVVAIPTMIQNGVRLKVPLFQVADRRLGYLGAVLGGLLVLTHYFFH
jgi:solute:Na+ symporter, SSS family